MLPKSSREIFIICICYIVIILFSIQIFKLKKISKLYLNDICIVLYSNYIFIINASQKWNLYY